MTISATAQDDRYTLFAAISKEEFEKMGQEEAKNYARFILNRQAIFIMEAHNKPIVFYPVEVRPRLSDYRMPEVVYSMRWQIVEYKEAYFATLPKFPKGANFWERLVFLFTGKVRGEYKYE